MAGWIGWGACSVVAVLVVSVCGWKPVDEQFSSWCVPEEMFSSETQLKLATGWASVVRNYLSDSFAPSTSYFRSCSADDDYFRMVRPQSVYRTCMNGQFYVHFPHALVPCSGGRD